ncbi:MAG TPA: hypothetical protein PLO37_05965 [Candidatus Hydrogenedentes bacterium]|nr:hypothetical protein [Candidatus Hydrogenedentota bacterium]HPG66375.1 hypothetical protein [Candidatus Hydrogenedentota bacterium]
MKKLCFLFTAAGLTVILSVVSAHAATLHVGASSTSITPDKPVALCGQMSTRIAREVETEIRANALAMESRDGEQVLEQALFVACDLVYIVEDLRAHVCEALAPRIPDFDMRKLVISATHTHTAPVMLEGKYEIPDEDVMRPTEFVEFGSVRIADAAEAAWKARRPAKVGWGMGDAVIGYNRRSFFEDGHAQMYGDISIDSFRGIEGPEDHAIEVLFFWDRNDGLIATAVNVVCPTQEVEGLSVVNADFWHPVREGLKSKYGNDLIVLGWVSAAGDQSPHIRFRKAAEDRMRELRGLSRLDEIARRIIRAWEEAYEGAQKEKFDDVPLVHLVKPIELPRRMVTEQDVESIKAEIAACSTDPVHARRIVWHQAALDRYARQQAGEVKPYVMDLHVVRLGDVAITTNDFELFTQFGIQMKAKSKALHTFVIQLAGPGTYVPTPLAAQGGGYSAIVQSNEIGPEGGQALVNETVAAVNSLWPDK